MALGNHEFDWGQDVLQKRSDQANFPFLAANIFYKIKEDNPVPARGDRPPWAKPYAVIEAKGVKVGVIGIAHPDTPAITNPLHVDNLLFTDPLEAIHEILPEVEAEGATIIVIMAHIGGYWPDFEEGIKDLACGCDSEKVDLIVSGHTHTQIHDIMCGIPVVQSYSKGSAFSRVDFHVDLETGEAITYTMNDSSTTTYQNYGENPAWYKRWDNEHWVKVVPDPLVAAIVDKVEKQIDSMKNDVLGEVEKPIARYYRYESEMGDWVNDLMRTHEYAPGIDFAMTNSGGLGADIDAGQITFGEVYEALPFDNTLVVVELDGNEVRQVLEEGITGEHGVVQVSGLKFTFNYDAPVGKRIIGDVVDSNTGLPLDPKKIYHVAVNDFMAHGGDGYQTLAANPQVNTSTLVRDIIVSWIKRSSSFAPPNPLEEQRIIARGFPPN
jgi:2',3'-cyclic-nucleotide 2'-phosphodiesterase (5'-nucleotidase family)